MHAHAQWRGTLYSSCSREDRILARLRQQARDRLEAAEKLRAAQADRPDTEVSPIDRSPLRSPWRTGALPVISAIRRILPAPVTRRPVEG